jgi:hypothetical protein
MFQTSVFLAVLSIISGLRGSPVDRAANFAKQGMFVFKNSSSRLLIPVCYLNIKLSEIRLDVVFYPKAKNATIYSIG